MKNIEQALRVFCGKVEGKSYLSNPFESDGRVYASDTHIIGIVNKSDIEDWSFAPHYQIPKIMAVNKVETSKKVYSIDEFRKIMLDAPMEEEEVVVEEEVLCDYCYGGRYIHHNNKEYECPVCKGTGLESEEKTEKTGKMVIKQGSSTIVNNITVQIKFIKMIVEFMDILKLSSADVYEAKLRQDSVYPDGIYLKFNKPVEVALMRYFD